MSGERRAYIGNPEVTKNLYGTSIFDAMSEYISTKGKERFLRAIGKTIYYGDKLSVDPGFAAGVGTVSVIYGHLREDPLSMAIGAVVALSGFMRYPNHIRKSRNS